MPTPPALTTLKSATSRADLASLLNIDLKNLTYLLFVQKADKKYISFTIKKKNGGSREINAPNQSLKSLQQKTAKLLEECLQEISASSGKKNSASHGFRKDRSIQTNASAHRNRRYVFNVDLKNFFPTITFPRIRGYLISNADFQLHKDVATAVAQIACLDSKLPQGSPLSPIISNMIGSILDFHLTKLAAANSCFYTRYADDLTFSTNRKSFPASIAKANPENSNLWQVGQALLKIITKCGFVVNDDKTRLQYKTSRQQVTGLVVNKKVNATIEYRRAIRSYVHSLVTQGKFTIPFTEEKEDGSFIKSFYPGTIKQLHGMLGFVHATESVYRTNLENHPENYPNKQVKPGATGNLAVFRRFLLYTRFFASDRPLFICEGKTDNVYLSNAVHQLKDFFPEFVQKNKDGKQVLAFDLFKYARRHRKKRNIYLPNFSTAKILGNSSGGGPNLANLLMTYYNEQKKFKGPKGSCPIIFIVDNDSGGKVVLSKMKEIAEAKKYPHPYNDDFYHVFGNTYIVPVRSLTKKFSSIEDLFTDEDKKKTVDGKPFDFSKSADGKLTAGKASFAYDYVAKNPKDVNFSGFMPLLKILRQIVVNHV